MWESWILSLGREDSKFPLVATEKISSSCFLILDLRVPKQTITKYSLKVCGGQNSEDGSLEIPAQIIQSDTNLATAVKGLCRHK